MGEKDIAEKKFADHNDVFADIVNGLLFHGKQMISPESLTPAQTRSQYKADNGKLHEMERDTSKYWNEGNVQIALYGFEYQSKVCIFLSISLCQ